MCVGIIHIPKTFLAAEDGTHARGNCSVTKNQISPKHVIWSFSCVQVSLKEATLNIEACRIKQPQEQGLGTGDEVLGRDQVITKASQQEIRSIYFSTADQAQERASQPLDVCSVSMKHCLCGRKEIYLPRKVDADMAESHTGTKSVLKIPLWKQEVHPSESADLSP